MRPPDEATTLPGDVYFDQDFFELEKTQLWKKSWVAVAEVCAIPPPPPPPPFKRLLGCHNGKRDVRSLAVIDWWDGPSPFSQMQSTLPTGLLHPLTITPSAHHTFCTSGPLILSPAKTTALPNPGDVIPVTTGNAKIILANDGGTIRAFHNVCRHRGAQLVSEPCTRRRTILCPYHRSAPHSMEAQRCVAQSFAPLLGRMNSS